MPYPTAAVGEQPVVQRMPQVDRPEHATGLGVVDDPEDRRGHEPVLPLGALRHLAREPPIERRIVGERTRLEPERRVAVQRRPGELLDALEPRCAAVAVGQHEGDHAATLPAIAWST